MWESTPVYFLHTFVKQTQLHTTISSEAVLCGATSCSIRGMNLNKDCEINFYVMSKILKI